eukprot:CAMPEP_0119520390 /NCGR_PEP_ID=MMETSP1344-20130328/36420_1 /TAXON_ID=236787 /ORGANISM="Florenciella parvula, Strain CCMP2471" /LENGTH=302 /DNA_ID=CAMNT_0007558271 /DNA_START=226 /DNA_END=1131 /DNA_ORIENTATION=-
MLAIPVKTSTSTTAEVFPKLKAALATEHAGGPAQQAALDSQLVSLCKLREAAKHAEKRGAGTDAAADEEIVTSLKRYFVSMCHADVAFGASMQDDASLNWTWRDSFKPSLMVHSRNSTFERIATIYNMGAVYSQRAAITERGNLEGVDAARTGFQKAAGVFEYLAAKLAPGLGALGCADAASQSPCDVSPPGLRLAASLMLAQAQACCYEEALKGQGVDAPSVSKLAASAAAMYAQALKAQREAPELAELDPSWARHLNFQEGCFDAAALWWHASALKALQAGNPPVANERKARLRAAAAAC